MSCKNVVAILKDEQNRKELIDILEDTQEFENFLANNKISKEELDLILFFIKKTGIDIFCIREDEIIEGAEKQRMPIMYHGSIDSTVSGLVSGLYGGQKFTRQEDVIGLGTTASIFEQSGSDSTLTETSEINERILMIRFPPGEPSGPSDPTVKSYSDKSYSDITTGEMTEGVLMMQIYGIVNYSSEHRREILNSIQKK